jgi:ABC-type dipeptide/oligopeptide/nickel transport system permease subunit
MTAYTISPEVWKRCRVVEYRKYKATFHASLPPEPPSAPLATTPHPGLPPVVRTVRSQVLSVKEMEYIVAARAIGASAARIIGRHIMPNCLAIYLVLATYYLDFAIIIEASLSFLGVGVPPDVPSWSGMLTAAAQGHVIRALWAGIFPGLAIFIAVLGFNLLGDALRDVLEPRLRGASETARLLSR